MIGIISDTHENESAIQKAVAVFKKRKVDLVVHCGDIVSPPMLEYFAGLHAIFVFGNNDGEHVGLNKKAQALGFEEVATEKEFTYQNRNLYVYHGTDKRKLEGAINSRAFDYILTGHTHQKRDEQIGKTRVVNPGALFRITPYTIAILDVKNDTLEFIEIPQN